MWGGGEPLGDRLSLAQVPGIVRSFDLFSAELSEERFWRGRPRQQKIAGGEEIGVFFRVTVTARLIFVL